MKSFSELCAEAVSLCEELPHVVVRPRIDDPDGSTLSPGFTVTVIAYRYPNTGRGELTFGYGKFTGEWYVLRGPGVEPKCAGRENQQYVVGISKESPEDALAQAIEKIKAKIAALEWPEPSRFRGEPGRQKRLSPVETLADLFAYDTTLLRTGDLAWVNALDGVPPHDFALPRTHWSGGVMYRSPHGVQHIVPNNDTVFAAPTGGYWIRVRDVP